jgi:hypothetical protein
MNDPNEAGDFPAEPDTFRVPVLLQLVARIARSRMAGALAADDSLDEKGRVMSHLITKYLKLDNLAGTLQTVLGRTSDPATYDEVALRLSETRAEQSLCKARYDAIDADQPFRNPGAAVEDSLLAAIKAVDRATQNTASVGVLLQATHDLIVAYAASSTRA